MKIKPYPANIYDTNTQSFCGQFRSVMTGSFMLSRHERY